MSRPFLLAQLSDLHVRADSTLSFGVVDTAGMLRACVRDLCEGTQRPDAVIITGDLTESGRPEEYAVLRALLAPLDVPLYLLPGNHDDRTALREAFGEHAYLRAGGEFVQYAIDTHPLRIVAIDTVVAGASHGELCNARLAWLERTLADAPARATAVFMHHPPFKTFLGRMDSVALRDPAPFAEVIRRHAQVEVVSCGHVHRPIDVRFAGTRASTAPSTAHHIHLDLDSDAPFRFRMEPPAYRLHAYAADTGLVSHTAYVGEFPGPYRFSE